VWGQAVVEYALLVGLVIAALTTIQVYAKRGLQARYRTTVDGALQHVGALNQYEPYYADSASTVTQDDVTTLTYAPGGAVTRTIASGVEVDSTTPSTQEVGVRLDQDNGWN
jgi:hypothetical protein